MNNGEGNKKQDGFDYNKQDQETCLTKKRKSSKGKKISVRELSYETVRFNLSYFVEGQ